MERPSSAVFLDRDGVIIENRSAYVTSWADVTFLPRAFAAMRRLSTSTRAVVLVTNQSAVGRGLISLDEAVALNRRVIAEIEAHGGRVDAWYLCPHHPDHRCDCRKPAPGMLHRAEKDLALDLTRSYMVGDAVSDMEAARAAGVRGLLVLTGRGREQLTLLGDGAGNAATCPIVADLWAALDYLDDLDYLRYTPRANETKGRTRDENSGHGSGWVHRERDHGPVDRAGA